MTSRQDLYKKCFLKKEELHKMDLPKNVISLFAQHGYFAGGCFASIILGEEPKDWDIFLTRKEPARLLRSYFERNQDKVVDMTDNAITLQNSFQLITSYIDRPYTMVHKKFDFLHTQSFYYFRTGSLYVGPDVWDTCMSKQLVPNPEFEGKIKRGRIKRFMDRGWTLDQGEYENLKKLAAVDLGDEYD